MTKEILFAPPGVVSTNSSPRWALKSYASSFPKISLVYPTYPSFTDRIGFPSVSLYVRTSRVNVSVSGDGISPNLIVTFWYYVEEYGFVNLYCFC